MTIPFDLIQEDLEDVTELDLQSNTFDEIKSDISRFKSLKKLNIRKNYITTISSDLVECSELEELDATRNKLSEVPGWFNQMLVRGDDDGGHIQSVKYLRMGSNPMVKFPLDLSNCDLGTVPLCVCTLPKLKELILTQNPFTTLPPEIGDLKNLVKLNLSECTKLTTLPSALGHVSVCVTCYVRVDVRHWWILS